jgi:RelE-like toxin of type II toxin-antitoxin system HigB
MLHAAEKLSDLAGLSNSLEALRGDREGQYAVRVNDQFRLCFEWSAVKEPTMRQKSVTDPIHPGQILLEEFMKPLDLTGKGLPLAPLFRTAGLRLCDCHS